ncbi:MAG TPA: S1 RNA-binding domain-containing protein [Caldisericia bacterium]|nr:S1 RNA-binding domain-containing protein [Caldisericia bacterium]HOC79558.1 S1 RNA-binding domain-containing protein [Caldisericia bacterium]HOG70427.1 S1 RNA-binding domain-containing protein [Caldisericia bacterium]HPA65804.1 S1 RNA-binding domain-containing protein [Caldisericia bacterium]HPM44965.1 S1 RNA-binding domain-containing protein [Caldisericia bacterium]
MMVVFEFDEETGKAVEQPQEKKEIQPEVVKSESSRLEKAVNDFEMKSVKRGQLVNATVVKVTSDGLLVDVGQKSEGFIPRAEASTRDDVELASTFKTGDMIQCRVVKIGDDDGMIILSKKRADFELVWDRLKEAKDNKEILTTVATKAVKGGLLVDVGVPAFVPRSQIDLNRNADPTKWVGKELKVRIIEVDRPTRRVVCSQKEVLEEDRERRREEFISNLKVGEIYEGTVVGLVEFGAFVDLGEGVEGLIHLSELSWGGRKTPQQVLKKRQKVNVKVIKIAGDEGRISLSLRQAQPHPWELVPYKYSVGDVVEGTVTRLLKFGAVVELEEGVSGLLHISQVSNHRVERIDTEIKEGQTVQCKILEIRVPDRKIRLSIKATLPEEPRPERQPRKRFNAYEDEEEQYLREFAQESADPSVRLISENDLERENREVFNVNESDVNTNN